ncbi:dnaJ homolog subfamily C member 30, mitochondrial-like [Musca vetustissima]|uniref:dnaJ homolog subfamily C member 30, mitochondrial-like n=1 Tax=Musca vetustissima TaxID=27455 RepID=UPI002AB62303|nr:dnaJ homolog subfamily C member 30, mitochondrial-like [Musca vetustissima]
MLSNSSRQCSFALRNLWLVNKAKICTTTPRYIDHYNVLGISRRATQSEIKAAYYRLSMLYHPDKNQGSDTAALKFREITQAYEVLGNYKLRRLYDKGVIHTTAERPDETMKGAEPEEEDDPSTKFYKSRFKKSTVGDSEGRSPIYDLDEWTRIQYANTFQRRQTAKEKYHRTKKHEKDSALMTQNEILLFVIMVVTSLAFLRYSTDAPFFSSRAPPTQRKETVKDGTNDK